MLIVDPCKADSFEAPTTTIVVSDHDNTLTRAIKLCRSPAKLLIQYPERAAKRSSDPAPYWLLQMPQVTLTRSREFDWTAIGEDLYLSESGSINVANPRQIDKVQAVTGTQIAAQGSAHGDPAEGSHATGNGTVKAVAKEARQPRDRRKKLLARKMSRRTGLGKRALWQKLWRKEMPRNDEKPDANHLGKRKREEETDGYLSFVERTMAAYKKL